MQRYFTNKKEENILYLSDSDLYHIKTVMRMNVGDKIEVVSFGRLFLCAITDDSFAKILSELETDELSLNVNLIIPVLKEAKMDFIIQKATELGVSFITPVYTERTIVKLDSKKERKRVLRWSKIAKEASEQAKRITIPKINNIQKLSDLEFLDPTLICSTKEKVVTIKSWLKNALAYDKINIIVGPEGGLSLLEENSLNEKGCVPVTLGNRILRAETAPLFALSVLNYEYME